MAQRKNVSARLGDESVEKLDLYAARVNVPGTDPPTHSETMRVIVWLAVQDELFMGRVVAKMIEARQS